MKQIIRFLLIPTMLAALTACNDDALQSVAAKANQPLPVSLVSKMKSEGMTRTSPIMMRIFKEEGVLEIWKQKGDGTYGKIADYKICAWAGKLGPKTKEGDYQSPEGYYLIRPAQMNPDSHYYLAFNIGYPNAYDKSLGRTGSNIMIHGVCSSAGCYSMTNENVAQIYAFARDAFQGGQRAFQVEAFPFRMTPENMARHRDNPNMDFWKMLKVGYDYFEVTKRPPTVNVCDRKYVFNQQVMDDSPFVATAACPSMKTPEPLQQAYESYEKKYDQAYELAVVDQKQQAARQAEIAERKKENLEALAKAEQLDARRAEERKEAGSKLLSMLPTMHHNGDANAADQALAPATPVSDTVVTGSTPPAPGKPAKTDGKPFWKLW